MTLSLPHRSLFRNCFFAASTILLLFSQTSFAETISTEEWQITADKVTRYEDPQSIVAEGNIILKKVKILPPKTEKKEEVTEWAELLGESVAQPEITADEVIENTEPIEKTDVTIRADWIAYDVVLGNIKARGNIIVEGDEDTLYADKADINLTGETGTFEDAKIIRTDRDLHLEGEKISKTGLNTYHIEDGWVITCKVQEGETPPWSLTSQDTTIEPGGYAVMKHAKFKIKDVPVFYTPYMVVPIKNTRQTGFLFPEFSASSNNGFGFNFPFFWNINDSMDMTFFPEYYVNRGAKPGAQFRYVHSAQNKGTLEGSFLDDDLSDPSETEYYADTGFTHTNSDRYWVRGKADHQFNNGVITRVDLDIVSDRDYLTEFNKGVTGFAPTQKRFIDVFGRGFGNKTEDERQNSLKLLKSWPGMSLQGELLAINDVRREDQEITVTTARTSTDPVTGEITTTTTNSAVGSLADLSTPVGTSIDPETGDVITTTTQDRISPLWKLPAIDFKGSQNLGSTTFTLDWDADYVNYWREEGIGGHRVDLYPRLSSSVPVGQYLESRAEVGVRDTFYVVTENGDSEWEFDDNQNRLLFDFEYELETTLVRDFAWVTPAHDGLTHEIRPYITYNYLPDVDQDELPRFDSVDFIGEQNGITYGFDNFFDFFGGAGAREYGFFRIKQTYDFRDSQSDEPFSPVNIRLGWRPLRKLTFEYKTDIDVYGDGFLTHGLEGAFTNSRGDYFSFDYRFNDASNIDQINGYLKARLFANWLAEIEVEHSIEQDETIEGNFGLTYQALCWSLQFKTQYTPTDTKYLVMFNLANIGVPLGISM